MKSALMLLLCASASFACLGQTKDKIDWSEKFNSPGATLVLKESDRISVNGQTVITYSLIASGLPKDLQYTLWTRQVGSGAQAIADAFINKDGLVINILADPAHGIAEDPINLKVSAGRGEPKNFAVISSDGHYRVFVEVIPFPVENSAGPCKLSATMRSPNYFVVQIVASGLQPKEEFQVESQSGNERGQSKATAADDGSYRTVVLPFVKGQSSGKLRFDMKAKSCSVGLEVPWGQGSYVVQ